MATARLTPQQERELLTRLQADPGYQRVANASYPTPMLRDAAIQNYVFNHPSSPLGGLNAAAPSSGRARGSYRLENGRLVYVDNYGHPTAMKAIGLGAIAAATSGAALGALPAVSGASGAVAPTATTATASSALPSTSIPGLHAAVPAVGGTGGTVAKGGLFSTLSKFFGSRGGSMVVDAAGNLISAGLQTRAANRASDLQSQYNQQALDFLKQQDARDFAEYLKEREREWRIGDEDRSRRIRFEDEREGRLAPFRANAAQGYQTLSSLLFNPNQQMGRAAPVGGGVRREAPAASGRPGGLIDRGGPGSPMPSGGGDLFRPESGLPPGVPPGSVPVNGGINPDAWAYQTPDGRIIRGTRGDPRMVGPDGRVYGGGGEPRMRPGRPPGSRLVDLLRYA